MKRKIKLLVVEDNPLLREGIARMMRSLPDITLIGAPADGESPVLTIHRHKPDIILLDLGLRSQNSLHIVETMKREFPSARIIVMDLSPAQGDILQFIQAGASGFVLKDATVEIFLDTIRAVSAGTNVLPPVLSESVFSQIVDHALQAGKPGLRGALKMTHRERDVIGLVSDGMTNKQIGQRLHIATHTVKSHLHNIMEKLALHSRLEVANFANSNASLTRRMAKGISILHR
jgi:DNA-binding NarL/FixJ family response regulator